MQRERREQERELSYLASANRIERQVLESSGGADILIAAPQDSFLCGRRRSRQRQGPRLTLLCGCSATVQTCRFSMEDGLMQCSLGSRSGTSGVELGSSNRSWAGDAISLAWQLPGFSRAPASFITPCANHHPHHTASTSTPSLPCMIPKPSSFSFIRSIGCGLFTTD